MTNKEILTAVLIEWAKPVIPAFIGTKISHMPVLNMVENWVKNMGIAPQSWSIAQDVTPIIQGAAYSLLTPFIVPRLANIPDEYIPQMAHGVVDYALQTGELKFFGGNIIFDKADIQELKNYLDWNMPYTPSERYSVITSNPVQEETKEEEKKEAPEFFKR